MITPHDLENRAADLTPRQREALSLVEGYITREGEPPSYGWLGRRIGISRPGAYFLMQRLRERRHLRRNPLT